MATAGNSRCPRSLAPSRVLLATELQHILLGLLLERTHAATACHTMPATAPSAQPLGTEPHSRATTPGRLRVDWRWTRTTRSRAHGGQHARARLLAAHPCLEGACMRSTRLLPGCAARRRRWDAFLRALGRVTCSVQCTRPAPTARCVRAWCCLARAPNRAFTGLVRPRFLSSPSPSLLLLLFTSIPPNNPPHQGHAEWHPRCEEDAFETIPDVAIYSHSLCHADAPSCL